VEILDGVEGLVHISELAPHHVESPREIVHPGDEIRVKILEIDSERRRLSLSAKRVEDQILPVARSGAATEGLAQDAEAEPYEHADADGGVPEPEAAAGGFPEPEAAATVETEAVATEAVGQPDAEEQLPEPDTAAEEQGAAEQTAEPHGEAHSDAASSDTNGEQPVAAEPVQAAEPAQD
jgi:small subunit ribosomal protein S1